MAITGSFSKIECVSKVKTCNTHIFYKQLQLYTKYTLHLQNTPYFYTQSNAQNMQEGLKILREREKK